MSIYKFVSVKEVIAKVYRDLNVQDPERWVDMIEWTGEALDAIHAPQQTETVVEKFTIHDYKMKLPCNLYKLNYVYFNGYPLLPNSNSMGNALLNGNLLSNATPDPITLQKLNGNPALLDLRISPQINAHHYMLDPSYLRTTFKTGDIYLSYDKVAVDEDGFPLVPDEYSYKTACFWYITKMLLLPDWYEGKNNRYEHAEIKWQLYCGQAGAKAMMPDLPRLENIKNQWVRLLPEINRGSSFFADLSTQERLNF